MPYGHFIPEAQASNVTKVTKNTLHQIPLLCWLIDPCAPYMRPLSFASLPQAYSLNVVYICATADKICLFIDSVHV